MMVDNRHEHKRNNGHYLMALGCDKHNTCVTCGDCFECYNYSKYKSTSEYKVVYFCFGALKKIVKVTTTRLEA